MEGKIHTAIRQDNMDESNTYVVLAATIRPNFTWVLLSNCTSHNAYYFTVMLVFFLFMTLQTPRVDEDSHEDYLRLCHIHVNGACL
jgi:hypothetical protein